MFASSEVSKLIDNQKKILFFFHPVHELHKKLHREEKEIEKKETERQWDCNAFITKFIYVP